MTFTKIRQTCFGCHIKLGRFFAWLFTKICSTFTRITSGWTLNSAYWETLWLAKQYSTQIYWNCSVCSQKNVSRCLWKSNWPLVISRWSLQNNSNIPLEETFPERKISTGYGGRVPEVIRVHVANIDEVSCTHPVDRVAGRLVKEPPPSGECGTLEPRVKHEAPRSQLQLHAGVSHVSYLGEICYCLPECTSRSSRTVPLLLDYYWAALLLIM